MSDDKQLDKIDIQSELKVLSPIQKKSIELKMQAEEVEITDKVKYVDAKKIRKALVSHRTTTKDLRLTFTRKLDNLKDQFIKKQDEVLEDSLRGEEIVKEKIAVWEKAEQERKEAEEKRMKEIISKFDIKKLDRQTATYEDTKRERARIKMERGLLEPNDRNKVAVKNAVAEYEEYLVELEDFIADRMEQERVAEEQRLEQLRLDDERKQLEEEKLAALEPVSEAQEVPADAIESVEIKKDHMIGVDMGAPEGDQHVGDIQQAVRNHISDVVAKTDEAVVHMLNTYGFKVNPDNIEASRQELKDAGYELIHESQGEFGVETIHRYKLMRLVDQVEIKVNTKIDLGE